MTSSVLIDLMELNARLRGLEKLIRPKFLSKHEQLQREVENEEIHDYEIGLQIDFYTAKSDEPLTQYFHHMSAHTKYELQIGDGKNHNDFYYSKDHEMSGENHCWLYHSLYDHLHLEMSQMLQIQSVWWDINVSYQYGNRGFEKIGENR